MWWMSCRLQGHRKAAICHWGAQEVHRCPGVGHWLQDVKLRGGWEVGLTRTQHAARLGGFHCKILLRRRRRHCRRSTRSPEAVLVLVAHVRQLGARICVLRRLGRSIRRSAVCLVDSRIAHSAHDLELGQEPEVRARVEGLHLRDMPPKSAVELSAVDTHVCAVRQHGPSWADCRTIRAHTVRWVGAHGVLELGMGGAIVCTSPGLVLLRLAAGEPCHVRVLRVLHGLRVGMMGRVQENGSSRRSEV
mmetsp:Transcript_6863/g.18568  ORF Transcript_6863/g.18568 Transcript_6863/m.18568 type:complete len:247 (+) Transcript_6863:568-1308(+)